MIASHAALGVAVVLALHIGCALVASAHALLTKPDPASAFGWIVMCFLFPLAGSALYFFFGINRVRSRARQLRAGLQPIRDSAPRPAPDDLVAQLTHIGDAVTQWTRVAGNRIQPLENGENAFPAMLEAINGARTSVWLATYIFATDAVGRQFIAALAGAAARGVQVRVLVDGVGEWYSWPHVVPLLRRAGVRTARFLSPRLLPFPRIAINLRNHRKLLIVDGSIGFLGGMNIGGREVGGPATGAWQICTSAPTGPSWRSWAAPSEWTGNSPPGKSWAPLPLPRPQRPVRPPAASSPTVPTRMPASSSTSFSAPCRWRGSRSW